MWKEWKAELVLVDKYSNEIRSWKMADEKDGKQRVCWWKSIRMKFEVGGLKVRRF